MSQSAYHEHSNLFGLKPLSSYALGKRRKGKAPARMGFTQKRVKKTIYWMKETICLRYMDQTRGPDTEEKMKLAQIGLGFKELKFDNEGDGLDVHSIQPIHA